MYTCLCVPLKAYGEVDAAFVKPLINRTEEEKSHILLACP